jgi:uncharacterized protein YjbI with pentapeptide repeats
LEAEVMTAEELLQRYATGERDFSRQALKTKAKLSCAVLQGINLSNVSLNRVDLRGTNLEGAILRGTNFAFGDLTGANLTNTDLEGAIFQEAVLVDTVFENSNLKDAFLGLACILRANFRGAIFDNTDFMDCMRRETIWPNGRIITDPNPTMF